MAKTIPLIDKTSDTFSSWVDRTNTIITTVKEEVITANNNPNGATTTGNSFLTGIFGANTVTVETGLRGGTISTAANLAISSNVVVSGSQRLSVGANVVVNSTSFSVSNITLLPVMMKVNATTETTTTNQKIDEFPYATYSGADYSLVIKDTTTASNAYQISRLAVIHNSISVYSTEYGVMHTNTSIGTFSTGIASGNVVLYFSPLVGNTTITGIRTVIDKI